jgi:hypothetical protein
MAEFSAKFSKEAPKNSLWPEKIGSCKIWQKVAEKRPEIIFTMI